MRTTYRENASTQRQCQKMDASGSPEGAEGEARIRKVGRLKRRHHVIEGSGLSEGEVDNVLRPKREEKQGTTRIEDHAMKTFLVRRGLIRPGRNEGERSKKTCTCPIRQNGKQKCWEQSKRRARGARPEKSREGGAWTEEMGPVQRVGGKKTLVNRT